MLSQWLKKFVSVKISLFLTLSLLFMMSVFLLIISQFTPDFISEKNLVTLFALFALFFIFIQVVLVMLAVGVYITKPLQKIMLSMRKVREGCLSETCDVETQDEFGELNQHFNEMIRGVHVMSENRQQIEKRLLLAEESLKYKKVLEEKAEIIERMNTELSVAFSDLSLLFTVSQYLNSVIERDDLIQKIRKIFENKIVCDHFALYLIQPDNKELVLSAQKGLLPDSQTEPVVVSWDEGLIGQVKAKERTLFFGDFIFQYQQDLIPLERKLKGSVFVTPLKVQDTLVGVLVLCRYQPNSISSTDRQSLESMASQIAVAFDRVQLYTKTKELSVRDELTDVYNRRYFHNMFRREFERAKRFQRNLSLLMIDVDHFKQYNDTYGHIKGDELLASFAGLLKRNIREIDVLARFGGEEFVILLADTRLKDALTVANKLRFLVKNQHGSQLHNAMTISIGVSSYPECVLTKEELIRTADEALYQAKRDGRDLVRIHHRDIFDSGSETETKQLLRM